MGAVDSLPSGRRIYWTEKGTGPELLCLHGLGGGSYFFTGLAEQLSDALRVVAVDLPGCGFSPAGPSGFSFEDCAETIEELILERLNKPATILGHSMGTILCLMLAARNPSLADRLIFVGGLPEPTLETCAPLQDRARVVRERGMAGVGDLTMPVVFAESSLRRIPDKVGLCHRLLELNDPRNYADAAEALARASASEHVSKVSVPCLVVTGSEDRYAPPGVVKEFVERLPGPVEYHEIKNCGHMSFFEEPEALERMVREFLSGTRGGQRAG
jgi:3-oxoadipate enol-lactonase